jgi:hypothetical protein
LMISLSSFPRARWLVLLFLLAGCAGSGETAVVTERPSVGVTPPATQRAPAVDLTPMPAGFDTVQVGRFDAGKMWTFDNPPLDYFEEAYGFRPDDDWFEKARLGALRFATHCSASFVSPNALVMTNHHCARESITEVSEPGEDLLETGFVAATLADEKRVKDLYVEQLISIADVTDEVVSAVRTVADDARRSEMLQNRIEQITTRLTTEAKTRDTTLTVQVIELYNGGRYSAYTFRRYGDVRLVMAPELKLGYFGGDPDNFTFPRYALDVSFFRAYSPDGTPLTTDNYFRWSEGGASEGETVFVVGNPGSTSRLNTVSQVEFQRDFALPQQLRVIENRAAILKDFIDANPEKADEFDLRNSYFTLSNSIKAMTGQLAGMRDPYLMARRAAAERELTAAIAGNDSLRTQYGRLIGEVRDLQRSKQAVASQSAAFTFFSSPVLESHVLLRALYGYIHSFLQGRAPQDRITSIREEAEKITDWPLEVEEQFLAERFRELQQHLGSGDPSVRRILQGRTPEEAAAHVAQNTTIADSAGFAAALDKGFMSTDDPLVPMIEAIAPLYFQFSQQVENLEAREKTLNARLARARFAVYGTTQPPDATFSLRIADGVVSGYRFNGTIAPAFTTFFGLYGQHFSYGAGTDWDLPDRWLERRGAFNLSTPLNLVSTNDIIGGNSGSPLLNQNLEVVGLVFDGNIESLSSEFIYLSDPARTVSVDARGIMEALESIYDAGHIADELRSGQLGR